MTFSGLQRSWVYGHPFQLTYVWSFPKWMFHGPGISNILISDVGFAFTASHSGLSGPPWRNPNPASCYLPSCFSGPWYKLSWHLHSYTLSVHKINNTWMLLLHSNATTVTTVTTVLDSKHLWGWTWEKFPTWLFSSKEPFLWYSQFNLSF